MHIYTVYVVYILDMYIHIHLYLHLHVHVCIQIYVFTYVVRCVRRTGSRMILRPWVVGFSKACASYSRKRVGVGNRYPRLLTHNVQR